MDLEQARRRLGVDATADALAVKRAHRRLARRVHPDVGGTPEAMREVNAAAAMLLAALAEGPVPRDARGPAPATREPAPGSPPAPDVSTSSRRYGYDGRTHDEASFVIEALPAEAFEALLVVTSWLGEVVADEPPYRLDVVLHPPVACWCRLDLLPDAGSSTVSLTLWRLDDRAGDRRDELPDIDLVRDLWVAALNELGDGDRLLDER